MNIGILKTEDQTDPLNRGYAQMTPEQFVVDINTVYRTTNKTSMTASEVFNAIVKSEFNTLSDVNKQLVWDILHLGDINPFGLEADLISDIFASTTTLTNLQTIRKNDVSRAVELGIGIVREGNVQEARL